MGQITLAQAVAKIAEASNAIAYQAGVGGMETAGSIVSYLAKHPERIDAFFAGDESVFDWPVGWHAEGCLTWHGQDGKIYSPEHSRRQRIISRMERGK